ncbi:hypothetical protein [Myceligenerans salitolerans]|uniref:DNA-directed RNA polymerase subunit P n=1 Tax=Myceligenerans salitolerans TaxID=1230528 RepID=A0ABS3I884_9MICO|nr:hypothetical protein [Myceligenerans salitolerans]MBO0608821.1 hypothetical protein [Myceligenerans salitolerans]
MTETTNPSAPAHRDYPCAQCGASVRYAAGTGALTCPYCGHTQEVATTDRVVREHDFATLLASDRELPPDSHDYECGTCGAVTTSDKLSQDCGFCGSAMVAEVEGLGLVTPEAVLPFAVDRPSMTTALRRWARTRWFAPSALKKVTAVERAHSVYLPHWTYDAQTTTDYAGQRGEHYWETVTSTDSEGRTTTRQERRTRWYHASGRVARFFDDVLIAGTGRVMPQHLAKLDPWPLADAEPYRPDFLAGHETLRYDVEPGAGLEVAKQKMARVITGDCEQDIGGDEQRVHHMDTRYSAVTFKLLLLPVWIATYLYGGKAYQVLINARTSEVIGERPWSAWKIAGAVAAALAVVAAVVVLVHLNGSG